MCTKYPICTLLKRWLSDRQTACMSELMLATLYSELQPFVGKNGGTRPKMLEIEN